MIIYYWDYDANCVKCVSHTCITADMRKRNEQVTKFIETIYQVYLEKFENAGRGKPKLFSFFSDNCADQFKTKYHFAWGSDFLQEKDFDAIFFNYFAPGHGKGICDSEGGIAKHAVANAALHGYKFNNALDLYNWLVEHGGIVRSKTPNATHSPDRRQYHFFLEGEFLDYHPRDLKIDKINCFYSLNLNRLEPRTLKSRRTSCFCANCKLGNFTDCLNIAFHGPHHIKQMDIQEVEQIPDAINLRLEMRNRMLELRTEYNRPYLVMIFENRNRSSPSFVLISPGSNFNVATVHGHKLELYEPTNYFNYTKFKIPKNGLCHITNHNCPKLHTQLIHFDKVCCVCVATTPAGNLVSVVREIPELGKGKNYWVYDFKENYSHVLQEYHQTRTRVFGNYIIR